TIDYRGDRAVRLAPFADRRDELAVLQLDAVVRNSDAGKVDRLFLAGDEVVVTGDVGRRVADVAEEGAERPVVVEAERQRADRAALALELDRHVHGDAQFRMLRPLDGVRGDDLARLVGEEVDRVRRVVPQQVVGPRTRLALGVHV